HRRAIVGKQRPRQTALLNSLGESVHQVFSGLREIPLNVTAKSRMVIENAQRNRVQPLAAGSKHLEGPMVEIEMPQRPDVVSLIAADLSRLASLFRERFAGAPLGHWPGLAHPAVSQHVSPYRGITAQPAEGRFGLHERGEVVVVQLVTPVRVIAVLKMEPL